MSKFTDALGREWEIALTGAVVKRIALATKRDLSAIANDERALPQLIFLDPMGVAEVIWAVVARKAEAGGVDEMSFLEGLDADANERAATALVEAILDFFRPREIAAVLKERLPSVRAEMAKAIAGAASEASSPTPTSSSGKQPASPA